MPMGQSSVQDVITMRLHRPRSFAEAKAQVASRSPPLVRGYEIFEEIGSGGMGVVYRAKHRDLNRVVALKMLRSSAIGDVESRERFRAEAEAVARLQHPNIIQVFEIGEFEPACGAEDASPFIALEFVDGGNLTSLTMAPQSARSAAELIEKLACAVHSAHELGVVHRDLKPANVLLTRKGEPKIADFGLAKQLHPELDGAGRFMTQAGIAVGTPEYMPPEQTAGKPATLAIDIYALGVILYELLTARVPFRGATPHETMLIALDTDPVPPRRLQPGLPRDLETICLKCLEKSPARRYASAAALAADLRCFLDGKPIHARRTTPVEKAIRWCRRNPLPAAFAAATVATIALAFAMVTRSNVQLEQSLEKEAKLRDEAVDAGIQARQARDVAAHESERANEANLASQEVAVFMLGLLDEADPLAFSGRLFGGTGGDRTAHTKPEQILERALAKLNATKQTSPGVRATLLDKIGSIYSSLGKADRARPLLEEALEIRRKEHGDDSLEVACTWHNLGLMNLATMSSEAAEKAYRRALAVRERRLGPEHTDVTITLTHLSVVMAIRESWTESTNLLRRARANHLKAGTTESREYGLVVVLLTGLQFCQGSSAEATLLLPEAISLLRKHEGNGPLAQSMQLYLEGRLAHATGLNAIAGKRFAASADLVEKTLGETHFLVLMLRADLACFSYEHNRDLDAAETEYRRVVQNTGIGFCALHTSSKMQLARVLRDKKRYAESETLLREAAELMRSQRQGDLARCLHILWEVCSHQGKFREGLPFLQESVALRERESDPLWYSYASASLAEEWLRFGKRDEAIKQLRAVVQRMKERKPLTAVQAWSLAVRCARLYQLLVDGGSTSEADEIARAAADAIRSESKATGKPVRELVQDLEMLPLREHPALRELLAAEIPPR